MLQMEKLKFKRVSILYPRPQSCEEAERWGADAVSSQSLQPATRNKRHSQKSLPTQHKDSCTEQQETGNNHGQCTKQSQQ